MSLTVWRVARQRHAANAFSGESARANAGRWNETGVAMVYTAATASLALLEILVHLEVADLLDAYVCIPVEFDPGLLKTLPPSDLPADWDADSPPASTRLAGSRWARQGGSVALRVPSVIVPWESNFLLNPRHLDFAKVRIGAPRSLRIDPRLAKTP